MGSIHDQHHPLQQLGVTISADEELLVGEIGGTVIERPEVGQVHQVGPVNLVIIVSLFKLETDCPYILVASFTVLPSVLPIDYNQLIFNTISNPRRATKNYEPFFCLLNNLFSKSYRDSKKRFILFRT